jgi:hypothetical protein
MIFGAHHYFRVRIIIYPDCIAIHRIRIKGKRSRINTEAPARDTENPGGKKCQTHSAAGSVSPNKKTIETSKT